MAIRLMLRGACLKVASVSFTLCRRQAVGNYWYKGVNFYFDSAQET